MQSEPDHQHEREACQTLRRRLPDREPFREVVQADPGRDEDREPLGGGEPRPVRELRHRRGAGPQHRPSLPRLDPGVVVDKAHEADDEAGKSDRRDPGEAAPGVRVQRTFDRVDRLAEHVPEEKEQDSRRGRREEGFDLRR